MKKVIFNVLMVSLLSNYAVAEVNQTISNNTSGNLAVGANENTKAPKLDQICFNGIDQINSFNPEMFLVTKGQNHTHEVDVSGNCFTLHSDLKASTSVFNRVMNQMSQNGISNNSGGFPDFMSNINDFYTFSDNVTYTNRVLPVCTTNNETNYENDSCNTLAIVVEGEMSFSYNGANYTCNNLTFAEGAYYSGNNNFGTKYLWSGYANTETNPYGQPNRTPANFYMVKCSDVNGQERDFNVGPNSTPVDNQFTITPAP